MAHKDPAPHCIMYGNPADGFRVVGPFDCHEDALDYYETELHKENVWIMELDVPDPGSDSDRAANDERPHSVDDGSCDPLYGQRMDSADMGEC